MFHSNAFRLIPMAFVLAWAGCHPPQDAHVAEFAPPDTLPFAFVDAPAVRLDAAEAAEAAQRIEASTNASAAPGLVLSVWATEELIEDPIALDISDDGEVFVTGSSRSGGLLDIRSHPTWRHAALAMQSVRDHETHLMEELAPERSEENPWLPDLNEDGSRDWRDLMVHEERLYRLADADGDGLGDRADVIVKGFNTPISDVLGGILLHGDDLYLASAPGLYLLEGAVGESPRDASTIGWGYGVHPGFFGHGMSGLEVGPEGRIYWGVGDMGLSLLTREGERIHYPNQGVILRSFPDGSGVEVFASGLRNTHEFAFDAYGNLISVDNDGDHPGERERLVYIVEGSDSGWRVNWQFGKYRDRKNNAYKVWMDEELFKPHFEGQAAWITPPILNYHNGPAGMVYNPGTALDADRADRFFMAEYVGSPAGSHVHSFTLKPRGAGFELDVDEVVASGLLPVGLAFGPDGALYVADWIDGWDSKGAGRIWKIDAGDPDVALRTRVRELLEANFEDVPTGDLYDHLSAPDQRVRRKAQFELGRRRDAETLLRAVHEGESLPARVHGIWGIWQLSLQEVGFVEPLVGFLEDAEAEVRAQAARVLGDVRHAPAGASLVPLLGDDAPRVRFFAAKALGRIAHGLAFDAIVQMLEENDGEDVYLRHAGSLALAPYRRGWCRWSWGGLRRWRYRRLGRSSLRGGAHCRGGGAPPDEARRGHGISLRRFGVRGHRGGPGHQR